jgi:hypothetical protein
MFHGRGSTEASEDPHFWHANIPIRYITSWARSYNAFLRFPLSLVLFLGSGIRPPWFQLVAFLHLLLTLFKTHSLTTIMFTKVKNAAIISSAIHLSGVLGHGFVRKVTIDGVEYVFHPTESFRIQSSPFFSLQFHWYKPVSPPPGRFRPAERLWATNRFTPGPPSVVWPYTGGNGPINDVNSPDVGATWYRFRHSLDSFSL